MPLLHVRLQHHLYSWVNTKFSLEFGICQCWLCWGLTSPSTIFQSCRDGAIASWVINQYFRGVKCLAQGHNTAAVGLEPRTSRSGVRHSTTEPPRSPFVSVYKFMKFFGWPLPCLKMIISVIRNMMFLKVASFYCILNGPFSCDNFTL